MYSLYVYTFTCVHLCVCVYVHEQRSFMFSTITDEIYLPDMAAILATMASRWLPCKFVSQYSPVLRFYFDRYYFHIFQATLLIKFISYFYTRNWYCFINEWHKKDHSRLIVDLFFLIFMFSLTKGRFIEDCCRLFYWKEKKKKPKKENHVIVNRIVKRTNDKISSSSLVTLFEGALFIYLKPKKGNNDLDVRFERSTPRMLANKQEEKNHTSFEVEFVSSKSCQIKRR